MKYALNNGDLYKTYELDACVRCILEKLTLSLCIKVSLCDNNSIIKRSRFQSDIFKI